VEAGGARGRAYLGGVVDWGYPILTRHAIRWISRFGQKKEAGLGPGLNLKPHETVTSRCGAALNTEHAAAELAEARRLAGDDRFSSIARWRAFGLGLERPKILALVEATFLAGLRKAGMPEE
jgi:hypothetical protein